MSYMYIANNYTNKEYKWFPKPAKRCEKIQSFLGSFMQFIQVFAALYILG